MCEAPNKLPDGTLVACRECWQCKERRVDDWVGRCIAESQAALRTYSITLTYGRDEDDSSDHIRAALLTYSDVQKYLKRLRKSGYVVRYFAVGEYGSTKGRAHWHLIVFYYSNVEVIEERKHHNALVEAGLKKGKALPIPTGPVPEHEISTRPPGEKLQEVRFSEAHWQHGWSCWEELRDGYEASASRAVRYVCKYLTDADKADEFRQGHMGLSKKPPLGHEYFKRRAAEHVQQGLAPQDLFYTFPDVLDTKGKPKRFLLGGVSADNFLASYVEALTGIVRPRKPTPEDPPGSWNEYQGELWRWIEGYLTLQAPYSELVSEYLDGLAADMVENDKWLRKENEQKARREAEARRQRWGLMATPKLNGALGFIRAKGGGPL